MLKVLHTADWHLGKRLGQCDRTEEHDFFLSWLIEKLSAEKIDILIVAGDVFDTGSPSNTALKQYYDFLWQVKNTCCKHVIIIGGNHDSVTTLDAPRELLRFFNVHVVGGVPELFTDQIIPIKDEDGATQLVVCAVPFLRDKDVRLSIAGETSSDIASRLRQGISDHYHQFKSYIAHYRDNDIPVIATGHLFAAGATNSESEKDIHVGNLGKIGGDQFPIEFDYVALGHLHRPQVVNNMNHIRYSGSPIPLSFSENEDQKMVVILHFQAGKLAHLEEQLIPVCRKLIRVKGDLDTVKTKLALLPNERRHYPAWLEVQLQTEIHIPDLEEQLKPLLKNKESVGQLFFRQFRLNPGFNWSEQAEVAALNDLDPKSVFIKRCESNIIEDEWEELAKTFDEAMEIMQQQ